MSSPRRKKLLKSASLRKKLKSRKHLSKQYRQSTLKQSFGRHTVYPKDSNQYKAITRKLAIFVGSSSVANSIVENLEFVDLLNTINPRSSVPGRAAIHRELNIVLIELRAKITTHIESSNRSSICCDVWSKKGLTSSYLGVTGHFFSRKDRGRHTVTLAVRRVTGSHTAVNIRVLLDEILSEWNIGHGEIFAIITDSGSNMVAAFKEQVQLKQDDDCMEEIADTDIPSDEEQDFLDCEEDHDAEFISYNRIGCFSHTLQLGVNNFGNVSSFKEVMKHAHALVKNSIHQ